jgi:hypothetical protein
MVSSLPNRTPVTAGARPTLGSLRVILERDLLAQSAVERLARALFPAGLLWLAIWWALA